MFKLIHLKKRKLLRAVILDNYVKLLRVLNKMEHSNLWKYVLFKEADRYFVIQDSDYDLVTFLFINLKIIIS